MAGRNAQQQLLNERLPSLLRDIYEGKVLIPDVPHERWDDERRLQLVERIYRGLPIGSITVWRTSQRLEHRRAIDSTPLLSRDEGMTRDYLVDGIGVVMTLFEEMGPAFWKGDKSSQRQPSLPVEPERFYVAFDLQSQTFRLMQAINTPGATELALWQIFDAETQHALSAKLSSLMDGEALANRLSRFVGTFFDFTLPAITVVSEDAESARLLLSSLRVQPLWREPSREPTSWYCDVCREAIRHPSEGWVEWLERTENGQRFIGGLRLVHQADASPRRQGCQYSQDEELERDRSTFSERDLKFFLGTDGLTYLLSFMSRGFPKEEVIEMIKRLHTPGYERARFHASTAVGHQVIMPNLPPRFYWQEEIAEVLRWADAHGEEP